MVAAQEFVREFFYGRRGVFGQFPVGGGERFVFALGKYDKPMIMKDIARREIISG